MKRKGYGYLMIIKGRCTDLFFFQIFSTNPQENIWDSGSVLLTRQKLVKFTT